MRFDGVQRLRCVPSAVLLWPALPRPLFWGAGRLGLVSVVARIVLTGKRELGIVPFVRVSSVSTS